MITSLKYISLLTTLCVLISCGGSGSGNNGSTATPTATPTNTPTQQPTSQPTPTPAAIDGAMVYMNPQPGGNTFACAFCHALTEPAIDSFTRPGHAIGDALRRPNYKNGLLPNFLDAVNTCLDVWMTVSTPWTEDTPEFQALSDFLASEDTGSGVAPTLSFAKADPLSFAADNSNVNGDPVAGQEKFNSSCAICHGADAIGTIRAPQLAGRYNFNNSANIIARKVRLSGPTDHTIYQGDSVGGVMPFWAEDRISNDDLENVIAFIVNSDPISAMPTPMPTATPIANGGCASTHPKIGQTATLSTIAHNVSGTATIVDDCTIRLDNFSFDGGGIDIRVYGGNGDFRNTGFSMGDNLLDQVFNNDTLTVKLPANRTLDDIDRISIWCIPVRASFGDGVFN